LILTENGCFFLKKENIQNLLRENVSLKYEGHVPVTNG